jgi:hypothetical protein
VWVRFKIEEATGFEIFHIGAYCPKRNSCRSRDISVIFIEQFGTAQQRESQFQTRRVQGAEVVLPKFGWRA